MIYIYIYLSYVQYAWNPIHEAGMTIITHPKKNNHTLTMAHDHFSRIVGGFDHLGIPRVIV